VQFSRKHFGMVVDYMTTKRTQVISLYFSM